MPHYGMPWKLGNVFVLNLKDGGKPLHVSEHHHNSVETTSADNRLATKTEYQWWEIKAEKRSKFNSKMRKCEIPQWC